MTRQSADDSYPSCSRQSSMADSRMGFENILISPRSRSK